MALKVIELPLVGVLVAIDSNEPAAPPAPASNVAIKLLSNGAHHIP